MMTSSTNSPAQKRGVTLLDPKGVVLGTHQQLGLECPQYLFKGDAFYVRLRNNAMVECVSPSLVAIGQNNVGE